MRKNILLTGPPRSGKSTLLEKIIEQQNDKIGFLTKEVRENEERTGFEFINHIKEKELIASIHYYTNIQVSRYFVDIKKFDEMLLSVSTFKEKDFLYLDEIGRMELHSERFKELTMKYLNSENTCVAILCSNYEHEFIENINKRNDIILIDITPEKREEKYFFIEKLIGKINKAKRYASEPERFKVSSDKITVQTDHGEKHLFKNENTWNCDCEFYSENKICSHTLAYEDLENNKR